MQKRSPARLLEEWLAVKASATDKHALKPLPTTRALGEKFGVSHGTAFRVLCRLEQQKQVWRFTNGRFYPMLARRILGRPKPLAVMFRRMAGWSSMCRNVMEGFTDECAIQERGVLLLSNNDLLRQDAPENEAQVASLPRQDEMLQEMFLLHGETLGGIFFDELWSDEALRRALPPKTNAVTFYRQCGLDTIGNIAADFKTGALMAFSHLLSCGYDSIYLLNPFSGYESSRLFLEIGREVYREISGKDLSPAQVIPLYDPARRAAFLRQMETRKVRHGLLCPEDNTSVYLAAELRQRGVILGRQHGLISVMGTSEALSAKISAVCYDFRTMGKLAAQALCDGSQAKVLLPPRLVLGTSTAGSR